MVGDNASVARPEHVSGSASGHVDDGQLRPRGGHRTMKKSPKRQAPTATTRCPGARRPTTCTAGSATTTCRATRPSTMVGGLGPRTNNLVEGPTTARRAGHGSPVRPTAPFFGPGERSTRQARSTRAPSFSPSTQQAGRRERSDVMYGGDGTQYARRPRRGHDDRQHRRRHDVRRRLDARHWPDRQPGRRRRGVGRPGARHEFGGYGVDFIDVLPRPAFTQKKDVFPAGSSAVVRVAATDPDQPDGPGVQRTRHHGRRLGSRLDAAQHQLAQARTPATARSTARLVQRLLPV